MTWTPADKKYAKKVPETCLLFLPSRVPVLRERGKDIIQLKVADNGLIYTEKA
jgi:hypothetical protein